MGRVTSPATFDFLKTVLADVAERQPLTKRGAQTRTPSSQCISSPALGGRRGREGRTPHLPQAVVQQVLAGKWGAQQCTGRTQSPSANLEFSVEKPVLPICFQSPLSNKTSGERFTTQPAVGPGGTPIFHPPPDCHRDWPDTGTHNPNAGQRRAWRSPSRMCPSQGHSQTRSGSGTLTARGLGPWGGEGADRGPGTLFVWPALGFNGP